jgi:hypothetical protein
VRASPRQLLPALGILGLSVVAGIAQIWINALLKFIKHMDDCPASTPFAGQGG